MKKLYFSALSVVFGLSLNAQTLTQANHAPTNGDMFTTFACDSNFVPSAVSGSASVWTYTTINTHSSVVNNYTSSTTNNPAFPGSDISVASTANNAFYYKSSATELKYFGGYLNLNGVNAQITYTAPAIYAAYPMSFGTTTTSTSSGTISVPNFGQTGAFSGTCVANADGTGTLVLTGKTFSSVIRVVTSQTLIVPFSPPVGTGTVNQRAYDYYATSSSKYPILSHVSSTVNFPGIGISNSTQTLATVQKNYQTVGVKESVKEEISLNVYPNPSNSVVNFVSDNVNVKSVAIYDITGKLVESQNLTNGKLSLNVTDYSNGLYIYKLTDNGNKTLKTGKITVTH